MRNAKHLIAALMIALCSVSCDVKYPRVKMTGFRLTMRRSITALLAVAIIIPLNTGCTVIGYSIGAQGDSATPSRLTGAKVYAIKPGTQITVSLRDSSFIYGKYLGVEQTTAEEYAERYATYLLRLPEGVQLPRR
ncbi:hypothetical protein ACFLQW_04895 [Candidatus Zixiibacteriota bacterium]